MVTGGLIKGQHHIKCGKDLSIAYIFQVVAITRGAGRAVHGSKSSCVNAGNTEQQPPYASPQRHHVTTSFRALSEKINIQMTRRTSSKLAQCILDLSWLFYIVVQMCYSTSFRTPQMVFLVFRCAPSRRGSTRCSKSGSFHDNARHGRRRS